MRRITAFTLIVAAASLAGCERYELDRKMEELCKKDGGIKVYETVTLSSAEYDKLFKYVVTAKTQEDYYGPDYRYVRERKGLVGNDSDPEKGKGQLIRWHLALYRSEDGHLLGEAISYGRSGGDFFTFGFQPSGNHCPKPRIDLAQSVFVKGK